MPPAADVLIRPATPADVPAATHIIAAALAEYGLPFEPEGRDADVRLFGTRSDHHDLVGVAASGPIGIASVGPHGDEGVAWVSKVFVAREARGRGVGRALLRAVHDAARAEGYRRIGLRTRAVFRAAIALYTSEGYLAQASASSETGDFVLFRDL